MNVFFVTFQRLITLFVLMLSGYFMRRMKIIDEETTSKISGMIIKFIVPILIINSLNIEYSNELMVNGIKFFFAMILIHIFALIISYIVVKILNIKKTIAGIWIYICMFSNGTFMGFPVLSYVFGEEALFFGSVAFIVFNLVSFSLGVEIIARISDKKRNDTSLKSLIITPSNIAFLIGVILFITPLNFPTPIIDAMDIIADLTTPLAMIVIGSHLVKNTFTDLFSDWTAYICFFMRLIILPLLNLILFRIIGFNSYMSGIAVLITAMPASAMAPAMAEEYGGDTVWASRVVFLTTLGCIITVPIINIFII